MATAPTPAGKRDDFKQPRQNVTGTDRSDLFILRLTELRRGYLKTAR